MSRGENFLGCSQDVLHKNHADEIQFCTQENWQDVAVFLSQELRLIGLPNICTDDGNLDVIALVNCSWTLLKNHKSLLKKISDLESQARRMTSDLDTLHMASARQRDLLEVKDRQSMESDERERRNSFLLHNSQQQLKSEKDETRKLSGLLYHRETQYQHEAKRKDNEIRRLQERVMKLLVEKSGGNVGGSKMGALSTSLFSTPAIEMTNLLPKPDGMSRMRWNTESQDQSREEELYFRITRDLRDKLSTISSENIRLKEVLFKFQVSLLSSLKEKNHNLGVEEDLLDSVNLPLDLSIEGLQKNSATVVQHLNHVFENYGLKILLASSEKADDEKNSGEELFNLKEDNLSLKTRLDEVESCLKTLQEEHLGEAFTLQIMKKPVEDFGVPTWSLGRPSVTSGATFSRNVVDNMPGITIIPLYNYSRANPIGSRNNGRRSLSGSRDGANSDGASSSGGGPVGAITKRKSPMVSRTSPTATLTTPRMESGVRQNIRPRSANWSGTPSPAKPNRSGSSSPSSNTRMVEASTRSLPRVGVSRRLNLTRPTSGSRSGPECSSQKPPTPTSGIISRYSRVTPTSKRTPSPGWHSDSSSQVQDMASPSSSSSSDELTVQLQLLGRYLEQRQLEAGYQDLDDSEMNVHLQNVRKALGHSKKG